MLVRKGTFVFSCKTKGGIPMTLNLCGECKLFKKGCGLYDEMRELSYKIEYDTRDETSFIMFKRGLIG